MPTREIVTPAKDAKEAAYRLAVETAAGVATAHELRAALGHLEQAAQAGHRGAQAQLAGLAGNWRLAGDLASGKAVSRSNWGDIRAAIDVQAWLTVPQGQIVLSGPRLATVKGYFSASLCDWLIQLGRPHLKPAEIFDSQSGTVRKDSSRDNDAAILEPDRVDAIVGFVRARIAGLADVPVAALEPTQILHYEVGQQFDAHVDFLDTTNPAGASDVEKHGQRVLTVLVYLNDNYEGGETAFPDVGYAFKGRKGDALVLWNIGEDGQPDWRSRHIGTAPKRGVKWLLSQWIRIRVTS